MIFVAVRMHIEHQEIGSKVDPTKVNTSLPALGRSQTSFLDVQKAFYQHAQHHPVYKCNHNYITLQDT